MRFSSAALILPFLLSTALAMPASANEEAVAEAHEAKAILSKRGFGCPNDSQCNAHVRYPTASSSNGITAEHMCLVY